MKNEYPEVYTETVNATIYTEEETTKGRVYQSIWGDRYRKHYSTKVLAPTVDLDTLFGGLTPTRPQRPPAERDVYLLQRKTNKIGETLGKTTGWIHRVTLKQRNVAMIMG